ncbi:MAG: PQQ-dependent sugar dehydrogenase, partial [Verrucomicrobiota bacterium]|nr:PQQ-dependent sugar dehydrogenase [Verrucomicrobiota bacterium]
MATTECALNKLLQSLCHCFVTMNLAFFLALYGRTPVERSPTPAAGPFKRGLRRRRSHLDRSAFCRSCPKWTMELRKNSTQTHLSRISLLRIFFCACLLALTLIRPATSQGALEAVRVASGFTLPLYVCAPAGDQARIFVAEQGGKIKIVNLPSGTVNATPYLDISGKSGQGQGTGILGMTFDPNYLINGHFYVAYTTDGDGVFGKGVSHLARFTVSADPNVADPASEVTVLTADQTQPDHNFDWIGFSPRPGDEGNLYICSGDGGGTDDDDFGHLQPDGNAQSTQTLLGKILRIHMEDDGTYTIPSDNPFFGSPTEKQEIFCYGLRNPFRASFDSVTHDMLIGDVGEHEREEIDLQSASNPGGGENFGWRIREGFIQNPFFSGAPVPPNAVDPIFDYDHENTGICVIGGYVYHGNLASELSGLYVFGDCFGPRSVGDIKGRIYTLNYDNGVVSNFQNITVQLFPTAVGGFDLGPLTSMGLDAAGELYLTDAFGSVFNIKGT